MPSFRPGFVRLYPKWAFERRQTLSNAVLCSTKINLSILKFSRHFLSRALAVLLTCSGYASLLGQTFQPTVASLLSQEVELEQANEIYLYLNNPSGDTLHLKWRQLEMSLPEGWSMDLCDYGTCYVGVPHNGTMNPVFDTIQPYLKLIVQPGTTPGAAWCWFRVQDAENSANFLDLYFSLFTAGVTATTNIEPTETHVFPNPARDLLVIDYQHPMATSARLSNVSGQIVWQGNIRPHTQTNVSVVDWPAGLYFLQMGKESQRVVINRQ